MSINSVGVHSLIVNILEWGAALTGVVVAVLLLSFVLEVGDHVSSVSLSITTISSFTLSLLSQGFYLLAS